MSMTAEKTFTRKDYRDRKCSHKEYYRQFVTHSVLHVVRNRIGADKIKNSTDPHMNDIPLKLWDQLAHSIRGAIDTKLFKACNNVTYAEESRDKFLWSLSDAVCIAKAAARIIKKEL